MREVPECSSFSSPGWEEKPINDAGLPDVLVPRRGEFTGIAGVNSYFVRQAVIVAEICLLGIRAGESIA